MENRNKEKVTPKKKTGLLQRLLSLAAAAALALSLGGCGTSAVVPGGSADVVPNPSSTAASVDAPYSFAPESGLLESDEEPELEELVESLEEELLELLLDEDELELEEELDEPPPPVLELELLEELLLELEESLLEPPFPPPPPPQAVSIETVIAAASATAITFFANLMVNFLPHFQNRQ